MYHSVANFNSDPWTLAKFEEQLDVLSKYYKPISLIDLRKYLDKGKLPKSSVVITFDDGYANNLYNAKPILEKYDIPATVFITTGYIGQNEEYWWDELERLFLQTVDLPESLSLKISNKNYDFDLRNCSSFVIDDLIKFKDWIYKEDPPTDRHSILIEIWKELKLLDNTELQIILHYLRDWAGAVYSPRKTHRPLTESELIEKSNLIEIGCHTVTHPALSILPKPYQRNEIFNSKLWLEDKLSNEVKSFSYPYGTTKHYNDITLSIIRDSGFNCACSNNRSNITNETDIFQLDRFGVMNWNGDEFQKQISKWLES